ncbi:BREX-1 system adenine-specific DNA-methyltransferase PglX [Firmicutes bacterium AM31-12AC]|nr:BREX-1 system adenine-specific DNA-methyltransferase PglX [Firmicutes bacterium AM31-12AC]
MDKNAIKKFAIWARTELIARVSLKGVEYGITEDNIEDANADSVGGKVLTADEKKQRQALIAEINDKGYKQVMEEVAYTWFNRFSALRFMEVNGYIPSHVRVFTDEENNFKPQIITEAIHLDLDGLDMEKVYALKEAEKTEELYKYLLIVQCNALNKILPGMFQKIADYTELLLPDNLLREGSVIQQMIELIPEDDWKDAVQIIGWLYQYYNSEKKDDVFAALKKNVKITKENIPAATQLFTPDWIVRYMVENSLGRLWLEGHPEVKEQLLPTEEEQSAYAAGNRDPEDTKWHYYLEEAEQEPEVQAQLAEIRKEYAALTPDQLKVIDPCSGSGHILAYMFDVLMKIYESYGYTTREAVASIVENNLYGLDIDDRAAQLAYFAVMMKARQYDRRFFSRGIQPHVYAIVESNHIDKFAVDYFCNGDMKLTAGMDTIIRELLDAKEYGSILTVTPQDWSALYARFAEITEDINMSRETALRELLPLVQVAEALAQKYDVVVTNPPYMASSGMSKKLFSYVKKYYDDGRNDLYTVFILRCREFCKISGLLGMIAQLGWMSLTRSGQLRNTIYSSMYYLNMVHLGSRVFEELSGEVVKTSTFVMRKGILDEYQAAYCKVDNIEDNDAKECVLLENKNIYNASLAETYEIEGAPLSYWLPRTMLPLFSHSTIKDRFICRAGMQTGNNDLFLRYWHEVSNINTDHFNNGTKWFSYNKGGSQRKWYGNLDLVVDWENNGFDIKAFKKHRLELGEIEKKNSECWNSEFYFVEGATWSSIASGTPMFRFTSNESIFDIKGPTCFAQKQVSHEELLQILGYLNSPIVSTILKILSPTLDCNPGTVSRLPYKNCIDNSIITDKVKNCMELSKADWDSFETSWDFRHHPLLRKVPTIAEAFDQWQAECDERFNQLKANEEELNRIFIDIYGLQDELTPEVENKDVTVRKADLGRDIRSFISYAVGCMFGRYSIYREGLVYAGGKWNYNTYEDAAWLCDGKPDVIEFYKQTHFMPDEDNIIPICDDEYFTDDIVGRFVEFVEAVYGTDTLDENLKFIADALGGKGQPKDVIRNYFLSDFYSDHCKIYQKRPIYWLFDSGKKNGFKALIYMHRYQPDTIARIRTDYVHEQQARYRTAIADLEQRIANASTGERVKLNKKRTTLQAQDTEIRVYEEKIHHLADQMISIDLDDGVKKNYAIFQDVLAKIK